MDREEQKAYDLIMADPRQVFPELLMLHNKTIVKGAFGFKYLNESLLKYDADNPIDDALATLAIFFFTQSNIDSELRTDGTFSFGYFCDTFNDKDKAEIRIKVRFLKLCKAFVKAKKGYHAYSVILEKLEVPKEDEKPEVPPILKEVIKNNKYVKQVRDEEQKK